LERRTSTIWQILLAVCFFLSVGGAARAGTFTAYGPQTYTRGSGNPVTVTSSFAVLNPSTQYTLKAFNGGLQDDSTELVSSTVVTVNGVEVIGPNNFNQNISEVDVLVTLQTSNTISVEVRGKPGGQLAIEIVGVDNDPPTISASASPVANSAGWNNTNVTVTFTCSDATSGVASCPPAQTVTTEGADQVISGTATDNAGNTASTSLALKIDKTPPSITASVSPTPNAQGWNNSNVTVTFTCSDSLAGVANCPSPVSVITEGANQVISGSATDNAGNTARTSITLNIDKTAPTVTANASPSPNAQGWNNSNVTVTFTCNDSLSGIANCPSPQTISADGANQIISGTATDVAGNTASASATINLDETAPTVSISSPTNGEEFSSPNISATGSVSDATSGISTVTCNGAAASVSSGSFTCALTLAAGANSITVQATDIAGNSASASTNATLSNNPPTISSFTPASTSVGSEVIIAGNNFAGGGTVPQVVLNAQGGGYIDAPVADFNSSNITFVIPPGAATGPITVTVSGQSASSASPLTIVAQSTFSLSISPGSATVFPGETTTYQVSLASTDGFTQLASLGVAGLPSGVSASFAPQFITAGQTSILTITAPSTQAGSSAILTITASATTQGILETQSVTTSLTVQAISGVNFAGRVAVTSDPYNTPLVGVTVRFTGTNYQGASTGCTDSTTTDASGNFDFGGLPDACGGPQMIQYDPSTVTSPPGSYSGVTLSYVLASGQVTTPGIVIHLPRVDNAETVQVQQNASVDQTFNFTSIPNLTITVYAHTTFSLSDGTQPSPFPLRVVHIPYEQLPDVMPPSPTQNPVFAMSIEPFNSSSSQPIAVSFPNRSNVSPGTQMPLTSLNPTLGMMVNYGTGTVSGDGTQVIPDPDPSHSGHRYGISHFDWHFPITAAPNSQNPCVPGNDCAEAGDAVDLSSGVLTITKTDIAFGSARGQVAITRTLRTLTTNAGPFGFGSNHNYGYMLDTKNASNGLIELIMPDGNQVPFSGPGGVGPFANSTVPSMSGEVISNLSPSLGSGFTATLRWKDGTAYQFKPLVSGEPAISFLMSITDANGNTVTLTHNPSVPMDITQITDPIGRSLNLTYDSSYHITSITDPIGRRVGYTYNSQGMLATVTDTNNGVTTYAYDSQNRLTSITDPRNITFLQNTYNSNGQVIQQTTADGAVMKFSYTYLNPAISTSIFASSASTAAGGVGFGTISNVNTSPLTYTTVTDALGNVTTYHFNPQGFLLDVTNALGQETVYNRATGTNLVSSITDPLGRTTAFTYDTNGNATSITRLAGTPGAVTTSFTFDPAFNKITSTIDPLGHKTTFKYDAAGNVLSITDPLGERATFAYDSNGEMTSSTDPMGNTTQFAYLNGELARSTDPLGRSTNRTTDAVGRLTSFSNALGQSSTYQHDPFNNITSITDPLGGQTSFSYDPNGNLLSVIDTDGNGHNMRYTYDNMDRLQTRTDPLGKAESYQYDLVGNPKQFTDRRGVTTTYQYDALNRRIQAQFGSESSIVYSYDAGGRLIQGSDSGTRTISRTYDGQDRMISETTPQGSISYSYDSGGRRTEMVASGEAPVTYSYDNDSRLVQIAQGTSTVSFVYDNDGRRTSLTLPNGVTMSYSFDAASQLTGIDYLLGVTELGNLTYSYDLAGRRTLVGGTFARTGLPAALSTASYNAGNQLMQFGPSILSYDANGNLTSDGAKSYTWNARNQLASISGAASASFQYDAFGRRVSKTVGAMATGYLYDGVNSVEELSGGAGSASMLTGGVDEYFQRADSSGTFDYLTDALGSTVALAGPAGALGTQYTYEPFGNTTSTGPASSNPSQFTGRENDATGLYFYRARYYSPVYQRYIGEDPAGFNGGSANLHSYANNSPTNFRDPSGNNPACLVGGLLGTIGYNGYIVYTTLSGRKIDYYSGWSGLGHTLMGNVKAFGYGCTGGALLGSFAFSTAASSGVVYGGGAGAAQAAASALVDASGGALQTISDTVGGQAAEYLTAGGTSLTSGLNAWIWDYASAQFASGLEGTVIVVQGSFTTATGEFAGATSDLLTVEMPILEDAAQSGTVNLLRVIIH
jgi:RHS repeat-associated protein